MNYLLLWQVRRLGKQKVKSINSVIASIIGAIYVCVIYIFKINFLNFAIMKILLSIVMTYVAFVPKELNKYLKIIGLFYLILILNTGAYLFLISMFNLKLNHFGLKLLIYIIGALVTEIINSQMWKMFKINIRKENLTCIVCIKNKGKYIKYKGLIDTGNTSKDALTGKYIFYASDKKNIDLSGYKKVPIEINTVNGKKENYGYVINNILILTNKSIKETNAIICFVENEIKNKLDCDMIVNFEIYEELIGGINI